MPYWPLNSKLNRNVDKLGATITRSVNMLRDDLLQWRRFPGLQTFCTLSSGPVSVYWWESRKLACAVAGGVLYSIDQYGMATAVTGATLKLEKPVSFVDYGGTLYMANGGQIVAWTGGNTCYVLTDGDAPTTVVKLRTFDSYLLALDENGVGWHSDAAAPETWLGDTFLGNSQPDKSLAMDVGWEEVCLFGETTVQSFYNSGDANEPVLPIEGSTIEVGILAPDSLQKIDNTYFFLDNQRKIQKVRARQNVIISEPINADLQKLTRVDNAWSFHLQCNGETLYGIVFPTDEVGYAYDYKHDDWTEIRGFAFGEYTDCPIRSATYARQWNKHLAGGRDGQVYLISTDYNSNAGEELRSELNMRTNWGSDAWKFCATLNFKLRRGLGTSTPYLMISHRDNGKAIWSNERYIDLGTVTHDADCYRKERRFGRYRDREWRLAIADDAPFVLISVEESVSG